MEIVIVSAFRNAAYYIERYVEQMVDLERILHRDGHQLHLVLGHGDSVDGTETILHDELTCRLSVTLLDVSHGGHHYGSVVHTQRFKQLAFVGNHLWSAIPATADVVGMVESDLIWKAEDLYNLSLHLNLSNLPVIIAPMVMHTDGRFYDTWAYRLHGVHFRNEQPFHPALTPSAVSSRRYYEMDSVGSVFFTKAELARKLTWPEKDVVVGLCRQAKELGARIILDSFTEVYHP